MIPAKATAPAGVVDLEAGYRRYVEGLAGAQRGKRLRVLGLERFLARFGDIEAWMARPTSARLEDVRRTDAWPFLSWCFAAGHVLADVDLLAARANGAHFATWCRLHRQDAERAVEAGRQMGWADSWVHQVCESTVAFVCMTSGVGLDALTDEIFAAVTGELDEAPTVTANHRRVLLGRIRALHHVCFQLGLLDQPPPHPNSRPHSVGDHVAAIPQPEIRRVAERYLRACSATLRPSTIEDRGANLELFGLWLAEHHPSLDRLDELDRTIIEEFLTWNRSRLSRGRRAAGKPVSIGGTRTHAGATSRRATGRAFP